MPLFCEQLSRKKKCMFTTISTHDIISCVNHVIFGAHHSFMITAFPRKTHQLAITRNVYTFSLTDWRFLSVDVLHKPKPVKSTWLIWLKRPSATLHTILSQLGVTTWHLGLKFCSWANVMSNCISIPFTGVTHQGGGISHRSLTLE